MPKSRHGSFSSIRQWRIVPILFVETSWFSSIREQYLDDERFRLLQVALITSPGAGPVIRGTGGIRKLRWSTEGAGKRGGLRVLYYWIPNRDTIYFLNVYKKAEIEELTRAEIMTLRKIASEIDAFNKDQTDDNA
jgi:hypothetical protein